MKAALYQPEKSSNTIAINISHRCIHEYVHLLRKGYRHITNTFIRILTLQTVYWPPDDSYYMHQAPREAREGDGTHDKRISTDTHTSTPLLLVRQSTG